MFMKNILKIFSIFFILAVALFINKLDIASQPQDLLGYIQNVNSETVVLVSDNCLNTEMSSSQKENNNNFTPNSPLLQSIMPDNNYLSNNKFLFDKLLTHNISTNTLNSQYIRAP